MSRYPSGIGAPFLKQWVERGLDLLRKAAPGLRVVSVNLQPEHKAVLEGEEEVVLTPADTLPMRVGEIVFHLRPRSFFQTNTTVTTALYGQARDWVGQIDPGSVLDLYCGVGGFALNAALAPGRQRRVAGIEVAPDAVLSARRSAGELGLDVPVGGDAEGHAGALALHHQAGGDGLDAAG